MTALDRFLEVVAEADSDDAPVPRSAQVEFVDALLGRAHPEPELRVIEQPVCPNCLREVVGGYCDGCGRRLV